MSLKEPIQGIRAIKNESCILGGLGMVEIRGEEEIGGGRMVVVVAKIEEVVLKIRGVIGEIVSTEKGIEGFGGKSLG